MKQTIAGSLHVYIANAALITFSNLTRIPRKASSHLLAQKSQEPQSECGY